MENLTDFLTFGQLLEYATFVPLLVLLVQLIKNPIDKLTQKIFKTTFHTMYLVFFLCFILRLIILALNNEAITGQLIITTFANSVFISTSGIGLYSIIKNDNKQE
ncbi:hypothetical protein TSYNTROOL_14460 [Tepidanaerobacter syntrophicus]|uniref:hypothetical protein n=1 Tax=Tepidanaerobacter syntrophicus TaxID=224999 RepID=UPI0022ED8AFB|nr:hypothetical protein [Tepidanaerobacter syntrophicus]GLI51360.1 hypothetical protein TSYNTROOL_14460 [Tepidanaerobacter syntrophicus]